jgi:hypothetical protein
MILGAQSPLDSITYEDLYARWERGNWRASEIDFSQDREQWRTDFSDLERRAALWNYSLFFWGEDAVADGLSPYIDAAPREEQKYFLATQQVDEARHAVFFRRFMSEVAEIGGSTGDALEAIRPQLTWGFRKVFGRLETMCDELRRDRSVAKLAQAVTLYHIVIEAALAQPGQHFITSYLEERDRLPGFREGMDNVAQDEQRHIGFGVKLLSDLRAMDPDGVPWAVADLLREVIPWTASVLVPPGWDERYITCFGFTYEDIGEEGALSLETKLRTAGLAIDELPGPPVFPVDGSPRERAARGKRLVRAGYLGEKVGPPSKDPDDVRLLLESVAAGLDAGRAAEPGTFQWDFSDAEPWHVVVANGDTRAERGPAPAPRVRFRARFEDFVDIVAGRQDPLRLVARGRLRPRGDLRWLWRSRGMFPK